MRIFFLLLGLLVSKTAFAVCPLCTFAVGAGIGLTQYLGIDDSITGLWIGGMLVSLVVLTKVWLDKKNITFPGIAVLIILFYYGSIVVPFCLTGIMGHELNRFYGVDKLVLGIVVGSVFFWAGALSYDFLKAKNNNKAYFPFQKVVMPLLPLIILSVIFYFLTK